MDRHHHGTRSQARGPLRRKPQTDVSTGRPDARECLDRRVPLSRRARLVRLDGRTRNLLVGSPDRKLLLRCRLHAHLCHVDDHAHRVHAQEGLKRRRGEQSRAEHALVRGGYHRAAVDHGDWQWVAVHGGGRHCDGELRGHLGHEEIWAAVEAGDG